MKENIRYQYNALSTKYLTRPPKKASKQGKFMKLSQPRGPEEDMTRKCSVIIWTESSNQKMDTKKNKNKKT